MTSFFCRSGSGPPVWVGGSRLVAALAVGVLAAALGAGPLAEQAGAQGRGGSVSFIDPRPLTVAAERLEETPTVPIGLRNLLERPQRVSVAVVGLVASGDGAPARLEAGERRRLTLRPSETRRLDLRLLAPGEEVPAGGASGLLVAAGISGDVARRPLAIAPAEDAAAAAGGALSPGEVDHVWLDATNYLPSWLSPLLPSVIAAGIVALGLGLALRAVEGAWRRLLTAAGIVALLAGVVLTATLDSTPALELIRSERIPVVEGVASGTVGVVTSRDGELADLVVADGDLEVEGLDHAAVYSGSFGLDPSEGENTTEASVDVRDWWPWALAALIAGILLADRLRRFFTRTRPRERGRERLEALWQQILRDDAERAASSPSSAGPRIVERAQARIAALGAKLEDEAARPEDVRAEIDGFAAYLRDFERLVDELGHLRSQQRALEHGRALHAPEVPAAAVPALAAAAALHEEPFDSADGDESGAALAERRAMVAAARELVEGVYQTHSDVVRHLAAALEAEAKEAPGTERHRQLEELVQSWSSLGRDALAATSVEELRAVRQADIQSLAALHRPQQLLVPSLVPEGLAPRSQRSLDQDLKHGILIPLEEARIDRELKVDLRCSVAGREDSTGRGRGDVDDLFELRACFEQLEALEFGSVQLDFGDGSERASLTVPLNRDDPCLRVRHRFSAAGKHVVRLLRGDTGAELASVALEVSARGEGARRRRDSARLDRQMAALAGLLAAGSGLLALYFADPSWGEPADYLAALLWGGVVAEAVRILAALAERRWLA